MDIVYGKDRADLEQLLLAIDRPGDFCVHGRSLYLMPRIVVDGVGTLSFPVPDAQARALVAAAERAPYGKGPDTRVDTTVRDCWQIDAARVKIAGGAWPKTFARILAAAGAGLGCPLERLDARLYKLLVYEPGGFFAAHRDTEKTDGMVATLSIALPATGGGGELIVRHRDREMVLDMHADEPSELAFAAFYADCVHETRPVRDGHRLSLVFNLCLRAGDTQTPLRPPDHAERITAITERLAGLRADAAEDKLVWLLEHEYTAAGLTFDALKNTDAAVAQVLAQAADRADCALHAAILHVRVHGDARLGEDYVDSWSPDDAEVDDMEIDEVYDSSHWIDGWVAPNGDRPPLGEVPLLPGELLPRDALDDADPDEQEMHEATGNEGVTLERTYHRAALVIWPRTKTLDVVASQGVDCAVAWVTEECTHEDAAADRIERLVSRLIEIWPIDVRRGWPPGPDRRGADEAARADMLRLLAAVADPALASRFVSRVVHVQYSGAENDDLLAVLDLVGPRGARELLLDLVKAHVARRPEDTLALLLGIGARAPARAAWRDTQREGLRVVFTALPAALPEKREDPAPWDTPKRQPLSERFIRDLFALARRCDLRDEADEAARLIVRHPGSAPPDRTLPAALRELYREEGLAATTAYGSLWRRATDVLLARSSTPPAEPSDWSIAADVACDCDLCRKLRIFCQDPVVREARFPVRQDLRDHLRLAIERHELDLDHETERRGRPYSLVCTKNRASHKRRNTEYVGDVSRMRWLLESAPRRDETERFPAEQERLRQAIAAAERIR